VNYPILKDGASCFTEKTCPVTTAIAGIRSRGLLSTGSELLQGYGAEVFSPQAQRVVPTPTCFLFYRLK